MKETLLDAGYKDWLVELKHKLRSAQLKAAVAVNTALIEFYFELGKSIAEKQTAWGTGFLRQLSQDLRSEFPNMEGFSETNLRYCRLFYQYLQVRPQVEDETKTAIRPQLGDELLFNAFKSIPWGHIKLIINKIKDVEAALFYANKTIDEGWSRNILSLQLDNNLFERQGKAIHNFKNTLPEVTSDLAGQLLKDPYQFDFLSLTVDYKERELENALVENITKFLLELGSGFAYVGKQVPLQVGDEEFFIDLLFYHLKLRAYVIIELKATDFRPEYAGKLSFYLSAANDLLKHPSDNPTIGLMVCKNKNNVVAEYALKNIMQPIGVSEYELTKLFPEEFKSSLPTIEDIERELGEMGNDK
jgi:predicted nuclease of restriction endonuclease-like (RecB) superfamily